MDGSFVKARVYALDLAGHSLGDIKPADQHFREMPAVLGNYYKKRHQIPLEQAQLNTYYTLNSIIAAHLSIGDVKTTLLDVAGSDGLRLRQIIQKASVGIDAYLADIDEASVRKAQERGIRATQLDMTTQKLPYAGSSLDAAMICFALEHVELEKYRFVLSEIHRALKPGGYFYFADFLGINPSDDPREEKAIAELGYKPNRSFFLGIYDPSQRIPNDGPNDPIISNRTHRLLAGPAYTAGFGADEIKSFQNLGFTLEATTAVEWGNKNEAGKILSTEIGKMEELESRWPAVLAIFRKETENI